MKHSRNTVRAKTHKLPDLRFEDQTLTSFSGLVVIQELFGRLQLKKSISKCFNHLKIGKIYGYTVIMILLVIHFLLGYRELRDSRYYADDPLVKRVLGVNRIPDVATVSRYLSKADVKSVENFRKFIRGLVLNRLREHKGRLTMDFDGSVQNTKRKAEGSAVGLNKVKKGNRSYYPLFCTLAQLGQVFDVLHRPGNVHDSNGAKDFILSCVECIRSVAPHLRLEVRMDSAFFSEEIVKELQRLGTEFSISVPFERFPVLKKMIEGRRRWRRYDSELSFFENSWKPKKWDRRFRFLFIRKRDKKRNKGPVQLDLFIPHQYGYDFKAIVTNKVVQMKKALAFHNGRGSQEGIFGEMKSHVRMGYVPVRKLVGNRLYLLAGMLAHNLMRELQMMTTPKSRGTTEKRTALWCFEQIGTIRKNILLRAGRFTRPGGRLTLTMSANRAVKKQILKFLEALQKAA